MFFKVKHAYIGVFVIKWILRKFWEQIRLNNSCYFEWIQFDIRIKSKIRGKADKVVFGTSLNDKEYLPS